MTRHWQAAGEFSYVFFYKTANSKKKQTSMSVDPAFV